MKLPSWPKWKLVTWDLSDTPLADECRRLQQAFLFPLKKKNGLVACGYIFSPAPAASRLNTATEFSRIGRDRHPRFCISPIAFRTFEPSSITAGFAYNMALRQTRSLFPLYLLLGVFNVVPMASAVISVLVRPYWPSVAGAVGWIVAIAIFIGPHILFMPRLLRTLILKAGSTWIATAPHEGRTVAQFLSPVILYQLYTREGEFRTTPRFLQFMIARTSKLLPVQVLLRQPPEVRRETLRLMDVEIDREPDAEAIRATRDYQVVRRLCLGESH